MTGLNMTRKINFLSFAGYCADTALLPHMLAGAHLF
jgi:hypothetical protein